MSKYQAKVTRLFQSLAKRLRPVVVTTLQKAAVGLSVLLAASNVLATEPPITAIAFAPDGKSVVAVSQAGLQVFNWPQMTQERTFRTSAANLHCLAFAPNGKVLAVGGGNPSEEGLIELFSWPDGEAIQTVSEHADSVTSICWLDKQSLFTASLDRQISKCDTSELPNETTDSKRPTLTLRGHSRGVTGLCLLKDNTTLVSVSDDQSVRVWNSSTGELQRSLSQHTKPIRAVALQPAGDGLPMVASASSDRTIRFWQPSIGRMVRYVRLEAEPLSLAWTNDGSQLLAACADGRLRAVDPVKVIVTHDLPAIDGWAYAVAVHPIDGNVAVAGTNGRIQRIDSSKLGASTQRLGKE